MNDVVFNPFGMQNDVLRAPFNGKRFVGAFAGKRGGKTEVGAVLSGLLQNEKPGYESNGIDPYLGIICAPTYDMLRRLSWKKFMAYWKPFTKKDTKSPMYIEWHDHDVESRNESLIYGISADKPERLEGNKANWIWIDEVFQTSEQFFLECLARVADTNGFVICTGSLGIQFINPKQHWAYKYFKEMKDDEFVCFEWSTADNPHFSKFEIKKLQSRLDPKTFKQMFTITWDITPKSAVYDEWDEMNEIEYYQYNPNWPLYICIDWGYAHPMSCGFYQYDSEKDHIYKFKEIFGSRIKLDDLYAKILQMPFLKTMTRTRIDEINGVDVAVEYQFITNVTEWVCDIAGNQERELIGKSNVKYFKEKFGVKFKKRASGVIYGISIVRSYIRNVLGEARFFVDKNECPETINGVKRYRFPEKDGIIQNENPIKKDDDSMDETRYLFVNMFDRNKRGKLTITMR